MVNLIIIALAVAAPSLAGVIPGSEAMPTRSQESWYLQRGVGSQPVYDITQIVTDITMKDGVNLSVTYTIPNSKHPGEQFPVLLDYRPYRKDDSMYAHDYEFFLHFGRRGYVVAKVDIRGTGSSGGRLVEKEYSDIELSDGEEIIRQLAKMSWRSGAAVSNGRVAMFGQSWGAFNALMLAARQTPHLTTVFALHGSEDLFYNDIHFLDGVVHQDEYIVSVDHENALPRWPEMKIDDDFIRDRFDVSPWHQTYLRHQVDSPFWRKNSGMNHYDRFRIPMYLVGGIYDAYADFCLRYYDGIRSAQDNPPKIKCTIGPTNHAWPQDSAIGPNYDGLGEAVRWFDQWMKDIDTGILDEPDFTTFVRDYHEPREDLTEVPGHWRGMDWPIVSSTELRMRLSIDGQLVPQLLDDFPPCDPAIDVQSCLGNSVVLPYVSSAGTEMKTWWGELLGDQAAFDAESIVFDSGVLTEEVTIIGFPKVSLRVSSTAKLAHWAVRLEDVAPDGRVTHVTGALRNGAHRNGRERPSYLEPGRDTKVAFDLHYTTWKFEPGHRIRVAVSNALFRVVWPSPYAMSTTLYADHPDTWFVLPVIKDDGPVFTPPFTQTPVPPEATTLPADVTKYESAGGYPRHYAVDREGTKKLVTNSLDYYFRIKDTLVGAMLTQRWIADDDNPARSVWLNEARQLYVWNYPADVELRNTALSPRDSAPHPPMMSADFRDFHKTGSGNFPSTAFATPEDIPSRTGDSPSGWTWIEQSPGFQIGNRRWMELHTRMSVVSDENFFYSSLTRSIYENGTLILTRSFTQKDARLFQ